MNISSSEMVKSIQSNRGWCIKHIHFLNQSKVNKYVSININYMQKTEGMHAKSKKQKATYSQRAAGRLLISP